MLLELARQDADHDLPEVFEVFEFSTQLEAAHQAGKQDQCDSLIVPVDLATGLGLRPRGGGSENSAGWGHWRNGTGGVTGRGSRSFGLRVYGMPYAQSEGAPGRKTLPCYTWSAWSR